jgi:hypothetical protein
MGWVTGDLPELEEPVRSFAERKGDGESSVGEEVVESGLQSKLTLCRASSPIHLEGETLRGEL